MIYLQKTDFISLLCTLFFQIMNPQMRLSVPQQQQFPAANSPQRASSLAVGGASGSTERNKVALKPGRSLMDWVRLGKQQGRKLNGVQGQRLEVTQEELAKHNKVNDGWLAIRGRFHDKWVCIS